MSEICFSLTKEASNASDSAGEINGALNLPNTMENVANDFTIPSGHGIKYVNSMDVMQQSKKGREVAKELDEKRVAWGAEIEQKGKALEDAVRKFSDQQVAMSETGRELIEKKLAREQRDLKLLIEEREQELKLAMNKATESLFRELESIVAELAKQEHLNAVIDSASGRVLYVNNSVDYSDKMVVVWDTKYQNIAVTSPSATA